MKMRLILFSVFFTFLIIVLLSTQHASADVIGADRVINGLITQQQINQTQKPQFTDRNGAVETIDPVSGALAWKQTDIHLPGREGLDLDIGVLYQNNYGFTFMRKYNVSGGIQKYNYLTSRYDLGTGWSFRFPSVQFADGYMYYHTGEGAIYQIDFNASGTADSYTHLIGYQGKDLKFVQDTAGTFSNGQTNSTSAYYLEYASKKREYFAADGRLLGIVDRYGNKIIFTHIDRQMYDGQTYKVISTIKDTVGRVVTFTYDTNLQTATDANFNGESIVVSVQDLSETVSQKVTYTKWRSNILLNGNADGYSPFLSSIKSQIGEITSFDYGIDSSTNMYLSGKFDYVKKYFDSYSGYNSYFLLNSVYYPRSQTKYQYEKVSRNLGTSGLGEEFRILKRYDQLKDIKNQINYTYSEDYSGYPLHYDQNNLPSSFLVSSTSTLQSTSGTNGLQTISTFNGLMQPVSTETRTSIGERKVTTNLAFHSTFKYLPISYKISSYGIGDTDAAANKLFVNQEYTSWGGIQSITLPLTETEMNNAATKSKYTTTYVYEPLYNQMQSKSWYQNTSDAIALIESYAYDSNGRMISTTNAKGEVTSNCYDIVDENGVVSSSCLGAITPLIGKVKKITTSKDLNNGKIAKTLSTFSSETSYAYPNEIDTYFSTINENGQPINQTVKKIMSYYMSSGLLKDVQDGNNNTTTYYYDLLGRITEIKYPMFTNLNSQQYDVSDIYQYTNGNTSDFDSTNSGNSSLLVTSYRKYTQKATNTVTFLNETYDYYNALGYLLLHQDYDSTGWKSTQYHYDDLLRTSYKIDPMKNTTTENFTAWGDSKEIMDTYGNLIVSLYGFKSRDREQYFVASDDVAAYRINPGQQMLKTSFISQKKDQWGNIISNRATKRVYQDQYNNYIAESISESYSYNIMGQVVTYTDPNKNMNNSSVTINYYYDGLGRLTMVKDALNQITNYQYDYNGNIQQVTLQANSTSTPIILKTKQFNEIGELTDKTDPSNASEVFSYNNLGLLNKYVDRNGTTYLSQYDEQNRMTLSNIAKNGNSLSSKSIIGSNGIMFDTKETYTNNILSGSMQIKMDNLKRVTLITSSAANYSSSLGLTYDGNSRLTKQTNNLSSYTVNYQYDKLRLDKVQLDGQNTVNSAASANAFYEYYPNGQVKTITFPKLLDGTVLKSSYTYNMLNRLTNVTNTKGATILSSYSMNYDDNGNIESKTDTINQVSKTTTYTYDKLNRLLTILREDGSLTKYAYDLKGNRSTFQDNDSNNFLPVDTSYTYDLLNRLTSVTKGTYSTSFAYDPNNLRYKKTNGSKTIQYQYNNIGEIISESNEVNAVTANYIRGDRLLAKKDVSSGKMYYYLYNGHGDVVQIIDTNGTLVNQYQYDEWGNIVSKYEDPTNINIFKYAGEQYDEETGLYYLRARFYDPSVGRFINEDTYEGDISNPLTLNLYTYVANNPLIRFDPSGNKFVTDNNQKAYLTDLSKNGTSGQKAWATAQLKDTKNYQKWVEDPKSNFVPAKNAVAGGTWTEPGGTVTFTTMSYDLEKLKVSVAGLNAELKTNGGTKIQSQLATAGLGVSGSLDNKVKVSLEVKASLYDVSTAITKKIGPVKVEMGVEGHAGSIGGEVYFELNIKTGVSIHGAYSDLFGIGFTINITW